jgi:hypothetical protein
LSQNRSKDEVADCPAIIAALIEIQDTKASLYSLALSGLSQR